MKLLIITQVIDTEHPILGFFHRWVEEFAKHCEQVHVIALQVGTYNLPDNVTVHSLGKEQGRGKFSYLFNFYKLIWSLRHDYDNVFVHMNQIYVILGAPFWRVWGKKVGLWYAHGAVTLSLKIASFGTNLVFTSTEQGFRINTSKRKIVGQGVDTEKFKPLQDDNTSAEILKLITVGRISQSKNIETLLRACAELKNNNIPFTFTIVGVPVNAIDEVYESNMRALVLELGLTQEVSWVGAVPNHTLSPYLQNADVFVHDGSTDSLDKTLVEAALCGCVVVSSNPAYVSLTEQFAPDFLYKPHDTARLAAILVTISRFSKSERSTEMHTILKEFSSKYSVTNLISGIVNEY